MSPRPTLTSGALILATVVSAAGLNYAVIGLNRSEPSPVGATEAAAAVDPAQVALAAAEETPVALLSAPVLAVAAETAGVAGQPQPAASSDDRSSAPIPVSTGTPGPIDKGAGEYDDDHDEEHHHDDQPSSTAPSPLPPATAPSSSTTATSAGPPATTAVPVTTSPPTTTSTDYLTYQFEGIAEIVVALHDGRTLEFWSVSPEPGWVFLVEDRGPREVTIKFRPAKGGEEAEFEVSFEDGRLEVKREY